MNIQTFGFIEMLPLWLRCLFAVFIILPIMIKIMKDIYEWYEGLVWKKRLSRLEYLSKFTNMDSTFSSYIEGLRNEEIFRLASGINVSSNRFHALMKIYQRGYITKKNLKRISGFIENSTDEKIKIGVSFVEKLVSAYSLIASIFLFVLGLVLFCYYIHFWTIPYEVIAFVFCASLMLLTFFVLKDFKTSQMLDEVQKQLKKDGMLADPEVLVYFSIFKRFYN